MKPKFAILIVAIILGVVATILVNNHIANIKKQTVEEQKTVEVFVARQDIDKGISIDDITKNGLAELKKIPKRYVATQAISSVRTIEGKVLSVPISAGEQLTANKFKYPSEAGLSFSVPKEYLAVSIPYDSIKGVGGMVKPGDRITVFTTFSPGPDGEDITKILLQQVLVIAVGESIGIEKESNNTIPTAQASEQNSSENKKTVTLALSPSDSEKLIFAQEKGSIWLGLHPSDSTEAAKTVGRTIKTVFK